MKFNKKVTRRNLAGGESFSLHAEQELFASVVNCLLEDNYYEESSVRVKRIKDLVKQVDHTFVAKLAIYAREEMNLRSVPLLLACELAKIHNGDNLVFKVVTRIVKRVDEITELLAYYQGGRKGSKKLNKLSKQIQKGLSVAFNSFDEYQFAKYNRDGAISLRDALFLVHPKPKNKEQQAIFDKIVKGNLDTPYTWEVELSKKDERSKADKWKELQASGKLGYMALIRNLRNILQEGALIPETLYRLADEIEVKKSKQFPFRFFSAYRELYQDSSYGTSPVLEALEKAVLHSVDSLEGFSEHDSILVACDVSGSMEQSISAKSSIERFDIGLLLGSLLASKCKNVDVGIFGDSWKLIPLVRDNVLANTIMMHNREGEVGYSTNGYLVIQDLLYRDIKKDKIFIFTDCQLYGRSMQDLWWKYRARYPESELFLFDLAGYGDTPVKVDSDNGIYLIAGWSDKIFKVLQYYKKCDTMSGVVDNIIL